MLREHLYDNRQQGVIIGDTGYPLEPVLITPFADPQTAEEEAFNRAFKSLSSKVERAIGVWEAIL